MAVGHFLIQRVQGRSLVEVQRVKPQEAPRILYFILPKMVKNNLYFTLPKMVKNNKIVSIFEFMGRIVPRACLIRLQKHLKDESPYWSKLKIIPGESNKSIHVQPVISCPGEGCLASPLRFFAHNSANEKDNSTKFGDFS